MATELGDYKSFEENSASAILRMAIVVAVADREFASAEYDRVESVYEDICVQLGQDGDLPRIREEGRQLGSDLADEIRDVMNSRIVDDYIEMCANEITDRDLQELAVLAVTCLISSDH